jgi:hypothetical protein
MKSPRWLQAHYSDPSRPDRAVEDLGGVVIALVVVLVYCLCMGVLS